MRLRKVGLVVAGIAAVTLVVSGCSESGSTATTTAAGASGSAAAASCTKAAPSTVASPSAAASSAAAAPASSAAASSAPAAAPAAGGLEEKAAGGTLTIGVKFDQPGLGLKAADGTMSGFDVEVAKYVAGKMGVENRIGYLIAKFVGMPF